MLWLVKLYPRAWRVRYEREFVALLREQRASPGLVLNIIAGAVDARVAPQARGAAIERGGHVMKLLTARCAPVSMSTEEKVANVGAIIAATAAVVVAYFLVKRAFGEVLLVQGFGLASWPMVVAVAVMPRQLKDHSPPARYGLLAVTLVLMYLGGVLAAWT